MNKQTILLPAKLTWQDTTPVSASFEDFYFSTDDGLNESRYVFLKPNHLPKRFTEGSLSEPFIVAETGFGTGLNFLITWQAWQQETQPKRPLHFFSIEKYPLRREDLSKALANWPELNQFIKPLIEHYPPIVAGLQTLEFEAGNVRLSLLFGDITTDLSSLHFKADAWYLDGFAPKKNPEMWTDSFFKAIAQKSKCGTTFSTFTSASMVRKCLASANFTVYKQEGFGKKREMVFGHFSPPETATASQSLKKALWSLPEPADETKTSHKLPDFDVAIIGAGLSGLATAHELAQQGLSVCLIEEKSGAAKGASGQTQLAMYAKLPSEANKLFNFTIHTLSGSIRFYNALQKNIEKTNALKFWHQSGLLQLAWNEKEHKKQTSFLTNIRLPEELIKHIDAKTASEKSGLNIEVDALWFEQAGWLDPNSYSEAILSNTNINSFFNHKVKSLTYNDINQHWEISAETSTISSFEPSVSSKNKRFSAKYVVIANSNDAKRFSQVNHLPSKPLRGQVTSIRHESLKGSKAVICGEGYLCPPLNNWHHFGATFDLKCHEAVIKETDTEQNIKSIKNWLPEWLITDTIKGADFHHSAGLRCTTPDYLPIVGQAPISEKMIEDFAKLRVDSNACKERYGSYYPNLFINIGHGSKGLFTTPLAAHIIRHYICGGLPPCSEEHRVMLSPARFIIKHLIQRRI